MSFAISNDLAPRIFFCHSTLLSPFGLACLVFAQVWRLACDVCISCVAVLPSSFAIMRCQRHGPLHYWRERWAWRCRLHRCFDSCTGAFFFPLVLWHHGADCCLRSGAYPALERPGGTCGCLSFCTSRCFIGFYTVMPLCSISLGNHF